MSQPLTLILADVNSLSGSAAPDATVSTRKVIEVLQSDESSLQNGLVLIVPDDTVDEYEAFEGKIVLGYRIQVVILFEGNSTLTTGMSNMIDTRDAIRKALHRTTMPTATTVYDSSINMSPEFDLPANLKNYDYSLTEMIYYSSESRN